MIFAITIISVLTFALTNIFAKKTWQKLLSMIFAIIFLISLIFITANDRYHYAMKKTTETTTQTLISATNNKNINLLLYQPLGNGTEKIYLYKTNESQKKPRTTGINHVENTLKKNQSQTQLRTDKTYWVYKNDTARFWFGLSSKNHQLIKEKNTFNVSKDWLILSTDQAKNLTKLIAENESSMQKESKSFIQEKVKNAMIQDPTMDQVAQKK
ncbi:DUF4811 domain-containing protein [Enterococcus sp. AZ196]|uniref:DUF4811 domain-containing protein n=1 Tax=Enterococcus sp. AZ196 TaxID=2774659 RepID=UPI003D27A0D0